MKSVHKNITSLKESNRTNFNRSQLLKQQQQHQNLQLSKRSFHNNNISSSRQRGVNLSNNSNIHYNNNKNNNHTSSQQPSSIQQIIDTFKLYIKSSNDLIKYLLHQKKSSSFQNNNHFNINKNKQYNQQPSQQLTLISTKLHMFITTTQSTLQKLHNTIQSSSLNQLQSLSTNYSQILTYTKAKYTQLLKQTYRILNIQTLFSQTHMYLEKKDLEIVKENKRRKLEKIKQVEKELESVWNTNSNNKDGRLNRTNRNNTNNDGWQKQNNNNINDGQQQQQKRVPSLMVKFDPSTSKNPRNLQMLIPPLPSSCKNTHLSQHQQQKQQLNLPLLAREQLQKQFLSIRIHAYNMYQRYIQHQHKQYEQRLQFVRQQQEILQGQLKEEMELTQQVSQEYHRLRRELDQVKTINHLIKKRYILRQSMKIDSQSSLYHEQ